MTRALVVLGAVRALIDIADALDELAHRFGVDPLGAHGQLGAWDLDAEIDLARFGIGVMWERDGDRDPRAATTTVLTAHLGPVALTAARSRPAAWTLPTAAVDCGLGDPIDRLATPKDPDPPHHWEDIDRLAEAAAGRYEP